MHLPGLWNLRDLASVGMPAGRLLRSDSPHRVDEAAWGQLRDLGVRVVVDLRTSAEAALAPTVTPLRSAPARLEEGLQQGAVMRPWFEDGRISTPLYYGPFTAIWPERVDEALSAVSAANGGVLMHCSKGGDRTGMVVALILEALRVEREAIIHDYQRTAQNLAGPVARALGIRDDTKLIAAVMAREGTTVEASLERYLDEVQPLVERHRAALTRWMLG